MKIRSCRFVGKDVLIPLTLLCLPSLICFDAVAGGKAIINGDFSRDHRTSYHQAGNYQSFLDRAPDDWECWMSGVQVPVLTSKRSRSAGTVTVITKPGVYDVSYNN